MNGNNFHILAFQYFPYSSPWIDLNKKKNTTLLHCEYACDLVAHGIFHCDITNKICYGEQFRTNIIELIQYYINGIICCVGRVEHKYLKVTAFDCDIELGPPNETTHNYISQRSSDIRGCLGGCHFCYC